MDREGVAAEFIYHGDFRLGDLFHNNTNDRYPVEAWEAGARAWNHWNSDNFDFAKDRFLICGAIGPCVDMDRTVADLEWNADHKFVATYAPGYMTHPDMPPLYDAYWEPFWRTCEERNLSLVLHAGYGWEHGHAFPALKQIYDDVSTAAGSTDRAKMLEHADAVQPSSAAFFTEFSSSVRPRRALAQLLMSGVFDRYPNLKVMLTEVRADWIPETLAHFDAAYEAHRGDVPAKKKPSEYWPTNCMAGASFIHKAEVEMRHEIGVETITFGRDYPHPEGTWPHTKQWLQDAFHGVPEDELRLMLGENAIRFFGLDRARLERVRASASASPCPTCSAPTRWRPRCSTASPCAAATSSRPNATPASARSTRCCRRTCRRSAAPDRVPRRDNHTACNDAAGPGSAASARA